MVENEFIFYTRISAKCSLADERAVARAKLAMHQSGINLAMGSVHGEYVLELIGWLNGFLKGS
jgi:hypothetical protein